METAYEAVYIMDTGLPEEQATGIVDKYRDVVTRSGGTVDDIDRWEPRRLAFEIKGRREGLYIAMNFRSEPAARDELDRIFRISDDVIRHLIIKQDPLADRFPSKVRQAESERREREMAARAAAYPPPAPAPQPVTDLAPPAAPVATEEPAAAPAEEPTAAALAAPVASEDAAPPSATDETATPEPIVDAPDAAAADAVAVDAAPTEEEREPTGASA